MSKLSNVKGRINYITSHARQENLYATYQTADSAFWSALAKEAQIEFKRSNVEGKCIEARELIIALPEEYTRLNPQRTNFTSGTMWSASRRFITTSARPTTTFT